MAAGINLDTTDHYQLFCLGRLRDPYPVYHQLRAEDPVHWSDLTGSWILTRYDDVLTALTDPRFSSKRSNYFIDPLPTSMQAKLSQLIQQLSLWLLHTDPPDHTRLRSLVHKAFTPRAVDSLQSRIEEIVNKLIDAVVPTRHSNIIQDFAYPLPATVIAEMLGVPQDMQEQFREWSDDINAFVGGGLATTEKASIAQESLQELIRYFQEIISERRKNSDGSLLSILISVEEGGERLNEEELIALCVLLLIAGHETTANLIGNGLLALLQNPVQMKKLQDNPPLIKAALEELLRYDTPVQRVGRAAAERFKLRGRSIRKGDYIGAMIGAANRDPEVFKDPDSLDVSRENNQHLSFGHGIHFCVGAPLARLEGRIAINTILKRLPTMQLETDGIEWQPNFGQRFLKSLPVNF